MRRYNMVLGLAFFMMITLVAPHAISQEATSREEAPQAPEVEEAAKTDEISIYGEVQAVDPAANSITVQYYDYDTDEEKPLILTLGKDTKFENVAGLNEIKQGDWVDLTYSVSDGKNLAKFILVEKEEEFLVEEEPEEAPLKDEEKE